MENVAKNAAVHTKLMTEKTEEMIKILQKVNNKLG